MTNTIKIIKYIFLLTPLPILVYAQSLKKIDLGKIFVEGKLNAIIRTCKLVIQGETQYLNISQDTNKDWFGFLLKNSAMARLKLK